MEKPNYTYTGKFYWKTFNPDGSQHLVSQWYKTKGGAERALKKELAIAEKLGRLKTGKVIPVRIDTNIFA